MNLKQLFLKTGLTVLSIFVLCSANAEAAELKVDWSAYVSNDLRVAVTDKNAPAIYRNDATAAFALKAHLIPYKLRFIGDLKFVWTGMPKDMEFEELTRRGGVSSYTFESDAAYIEVLDILPYLDLRIGRQIVQWGTADMFNPTNNINALDLEDPFMFGRTVANQMIKLDFNPADSDFVLTTVWVPVFQSAQLPKSALLAVGDSTSKFPFVNPATRLEAENLRNIYLQNADNFEIINPNVHVRMPGYDLKNSQFGVKAQWMTGNIDTSISYYIGRDSIPVSKSSYSTQESTGDFNHGTPVMRVFTDVDLYYPKKQVLGFDFAGELPFLGNMGFWFEGAVTFPEAVKMKFDITNIVPTAKVINDYVVHANPFFKCTAGLDYSIGKHLFVLGQFMHGFPDEFGIDAIQNYWMAVAEIKFLQDRINFRNVVLGEIPHQDTDLTMDNNDNGQPDSEAIGATNDGKIGSLVYYPELIVHLLDGLEMSIGAYLAFGHKESKFAMDAAGPSQVFLRAKASF